MKILPYCLSIILILAVPVLASEPESPHYRLSFEDFDFLEDDYVARSGFKTVEDRGLELVEGRFGKAMFLNKENRFEILDDMTGTDLDMVTAVAYNTRHRRRQWDVYNEPFLWGFGKCNTKTGAVAFWVKGPIKKGELFMQSAMAWGRLERFLLAVTVDENKHLGAYIKDSRYVTHEIQSDAEWNDTGWNHVVLNWDMANGLELFLNGKSVAGNWGEDAWWETPLPGLFHLPMPKVAYDEFCYFMHPLTTDEIGSLMESNGIAQRPAAKERTVAERDRMALTLGLSHSLNLPVIHPANGATALSFKEVEPTHFGDENNPAWFCRDGRYELAWPHQLATFTLVPGDADFQAEKLDVEVSAETPFNYVSIEGNLTGLPTAFFDAEKKGASYTGVPFFNIPQNNGFFFATQVERKSHPRFTLPFVKGYGAPGKYTGDVLLPLTGETRVHEVGLFDVTEKELKLSNSDISLSLAGYSTELDGSKFAKLKASTFPLQGWTDVVLSNSPENETAWIQTGYLQRMSLSSGEIQAGTTVGSVVLDVTLRTKSPEDILLVRLHDPAMPHRIWTHAEIKMQGFNGPDGGRLLLWLESSPLIFGEGDRLWIDIATYDNAEILTGGKESGSVILKTAAFDDAKEAYEHKAIYPTMAEFTKAYHHRPWAFENTWPDVENPRSLGGQFDSVLPALAVQRILPESFLANFYIDWAKPKYYWGRMLDEEKNFPIKDITIPPGVPRWAYLQKRMQEFRYRVTGYLIEHQNSDGQLWGGWNDDTLILRGRPDLPMDNHTGALDMYLKVYEGLDRTKLFANGYCQIQPIDNLHNGDFVRERFRAVMYRLGDPIIYRRAMETAWHWNKPFQTPINWGNGKPFLFAKDILDWYWGKNVPHRAWKSPDWERIDTALSRSVSYNDESMYYRFTGAHVHTDNSIIANEEYVGRMLLGGDVNSTISAAWPGGGGVDLARWVTYADSTSLTCRIFSFDDAPREVTARLFRIGYGDYEIAVHEDNNGEAGAKLTSNKQRLRRFDTVTFTVPPKREVLLSVRQLKKRNEPETLPDLALAREDCDRKDNTLSIRICNLGDGLSEKTTIVVYNERGKKVGEGKIEAIEPSDDFVVKYRWISFENIPRTGKLRIIIDPDDKQIEILEENNEIIMPG